MPNYSALASIVMDRDEEPPTHKREEPLAALHELIDALTAVGNYLTAANRFFDGIPPLKQEKRLGEALAKSLDQSLRANDAARQLRHCLSRRAAADTAGSRTSVSRF